MPTKQHSGGCLCGAVRYECGEPVSAAVLCHCESCRRAAAAHAVAWMTVRRSAFSLAGVEPREYASSPAVVRTFCGACGTPLTYWHKDAAELIDVTIASLDDPGAIVPTEHLWMEDAPAWDRPGDGLPQYRTSRQAAEPFHP